MFKIVSTKAWKELHEMEYVLGEVYQLVGAYRDIIPDANKWLDNLAAGKLVHDDLLPVSKPNGWQPIETAPKDCVDKIIWLPDGKAYTGWFAKGDWRMFGYNQDIVRVHPTHWMPLTTPPKEI